MIYTGESSYKSVGSLVEGRDMTRRVSAIFFLVCLLWNDKTRGK
jgi:hypothetical protein